MSIKAYRVEKVERKEGHTQYYLVKDIRVGNRKAKITKYLGKEKPSDRSVKELSDKYRSEMELKAIEKKADLSASAFSSHPFNEAEGREFIITMERFRFLFQTFRSFLTVDEARRYEEQLEHRYVGGTTAIEGNTLTLKQTHLLLKEGIVPDKPLREINEVQNFRLVKKLRDRHKGRITIELIKKFHSLIMCNIDMNTSGEFRRIDDITIVGREGALCPAVMIGEELESALAEHYGSLEEKVHPFVAAMIFHQRFECIHPFTDGNGRVGREIFNLMLMEHGLPRMLFLGEDRREYLEALALGDEEKDRDMILKFAQLLVSQRKDIADEKLRSVLRSSV